MQLLPEFKTVLDLLKELTNQSRDRQAVRDLIVAQNAVAALNATYLKHLAAQAQQAVELVEANAQVTKLGKENADLREQIVALQQQAAALKAEHEELKRKRTPGRVETIPRPPRRILI